MFGWFKRKPPSVGPDFSGVDTHEKVEKLLQEGSLEELLLIPVEFGGQDIPQNVVCVPVGIAAVKAGIDANVITPMVAQGQLSRYDASLEYQGKSFIPIAIKIVASDPGSFTTTISIWGDALSRART